MANGGNGFEGRIGVVESTRGSRKWSEEVKTRIVVESFQAAARAVGVARRHGVLVQQHSDWWRQARQGLLALPEDAMEGLEGRCCTTLSAEDSHREPMRLDGLHEQAITRPYRTMNWSGYTASLRKHGSLLIWLDKEMTWLAPHDGRPGRPVVFSDATIQFCLTIKVLIKLPLRQTTGMVAGLLKMAGLDWAEPDYTTLCRRQKTLAIQIPYRRPELAVVDRGYRGHGEGKTRVLISGMRRGLTPKVIADLCRRRAIEAEIGHMKNRSPPVPKSTERHVW